ncbi:MAG: hypothetical protein ABIP03_11565 [Aquihabitans sp.]
MTEERTKYFFVHMQKTAGTALFRRLRHHFGTSPVYPRPEEQGTPEVVLSVEHLQARLAELGDGIEVVTGHFPLATVDLLPGSYRTFTVLRDPVERVLSFLRHQREVESRFQNATLEQIYADPVSTGGLVSNHMVKMLAIQAPAMTNGALSPVSVDDALLARARTNLVDRIDVMGLQEYFEEFCTDLERIFSWDLGEPVFMNRTAPAAEPEGLRELIEADNTYDRALYDFATEHWHRTRPSSPPA